ncbi:MAG: hypothetical protein SPD47_05105, partial [Oscillospiraceae bacterium]|nr:hypothetical protein [Oscillospiraceae bacterium]
SVPEILFSLSLLAKVHRSSWTDLFVYSCFYYTTFALSSLLVLCGIALKYNNMNIIFKHYKKQILNM